MTKDKGEALKARLEELQELFLKEEISAEEYALLKKNLEEKQSKEVEKEEADDKEKEEKIKIKGMHCKSCVDSIEKKLKALEGIKSAKVSLLDDEASVVFSPKKVNITKIKKEIETLGYNCCGSDVPVKKESGGLKQGIIYGLVPHIGCIIFLIASILGATVLMQFFKPLLLNRYIFHILILISIGFATLSSVIYLRKNDLLSWGGIKRKKGYLGIMYGSTIGINLLLFFLIFPLLANVSSATGSVIADPNDAGFIKLKVDIPCPGHASLISGEIKTVEGIADVRFSFPNNFDVTYDKTKTSEKEILSIDVFNTYKATKIS